MRKNRFHYRRVWIVEKDGVRFIFLGDKAQNHEIVLRVAISPLTWTLHQTMNVLGKMLNLARRRLVELRRTAQKFYREHLGSVSLHSLLNRLLKTDGAAERKILICGEEELGDLPYQPQRSRDLLPLACT